MPPRILVCEDDAAIRLLICIILNQMSLPVIECENGAMAMPLLLKQDFDLAILDLMMPVMNGFEVVDQLQLLKPEILARTIVLTAAARARRKPLTAPVATVLLKPFDLDEFRSAVKAILALGSVPGQRIGRPSATLSPQDAPPDRRPLSDG